METPTPCRFSGLAPRTHADARALEREAARALADATREWASLTGGGKRESFRRRIAEVIEMAERAVALGSSSARRTLARAHAARAEDAARGAGQLSMSAQRAPTREACDEGWMRVEAIVAGAEESARIAAELDASAAKRAEAAARRARKIIEDRNGAYTFHTDSAFSFGEGWHVAAAAVLDASVTIQLEPEKRWAHEAERFLRDAGLGDRLSPYRSRPRTLKQTTEIVARVFREDAQAAQRKLRAAFLGKEPIPRPLIEWIDERLGGAPQGKKVLLWIRDATHDPHRNTTAVELDDLVRRARVVGLVPILIGEAPPSDGVALDAIDLTLFSRASIFRGDDARRAQLRLFEHLSRTHDLVGQLGVTTAGMDGPALMGLPTLYLTEAPNLRLRLWVDVVPGYREIVREGDYLERVSAVLREWA